MSYFWQEIKTTNEQQKMFKLCKDLVFVDLLHQTLKSKLSSATASTPRPCQQLLSIVACVRYFSFEAETSSKGSRQVGISPPVGIHNGGPRGLSGSRMLLFKTRSCSSAWRSAQMFLNVSRVMWSVVLWRGTRIWCLVRKLSRGYLVMWSAVLCRGTRMWCLVRKLSLGYLAVTVACSEIHLSSHIHFNSDPPALAVLEYYHRLLQRHQA